MADGARNLRINPFIVAEDHLATGEKWEDWIVELEREMRFFKVRSTEDKKDALLIFGGPEIRRLNKCLPDTEESNTYINLKTKLTNYFAPKKEKCTLCTICLSKTTPLAGESIVSIAMRLRDKANSCDFRNNDERILEQIIQMTENKDLIRNVIRNKWSLEQTLTEMQIIEETEEQVRVMSTRSTADVAQINRIRFYKDINVNLTCKYCGKNHPWRKYLCPAYGKKCIKCGKFNHFAAVCKSNTMLRNQQRNRVDTCRNVYRIPENSERSNSHELEDDIFIGDSIFHPKGLQNSGSQIKKVSDTSQSCIPPNRSKRQYSYKQISEESKSNETMTKPLYGQFVIEECVQGGSAMQMQLKQAEEILHKQSQKQEEILWHQMHTKEEIKMLQSSIFKRDMLLNNLDSELKAFSSKYDILKENYEQFSQTLNNQLNEGINKEVQLRNEIEELKNAHEAEINKINEIFKRHILELQTELDSAKIESSNVSIRENDEDTVDLDDKEVYAPGIVFEQNNKDKCKSKQDKRTLLMIKEQCKDQLEVSSKADTQNTNYGRTVGTISDTSFIIQPPDLGNNSNSMEQNTTERRNHVRRERRLTDEFRDEFREYLLEYNYC